MADLELRIVVRDDGSVVVKRFGSDAKQSFENAAQGAKSLQAEVTTLARVGGAALTAAAGTVAFLGKQALDTARSFESAFTGVQKTVEATPEEFAVLRRELEDLSREIPIAAEEIFGIAEAAGQLGIQTSEITDFTDVMAKLGVTTNLAATEAATALARFRNITGETGNSFEQLGSTIVDLGNNLATTEAEIVTFGTRLAGAGTAIGLTEDQILGIGAALSSVGLEAESGSTAFQKLFIQLGSAAKTGGDALAGFAEVAGQTTEEFQSLFEEDAAAAITEFVAGLGQIRDQGGNVFAVMEDLGLSGVRVQRALLAASGGIDTFRSSLDIANTAMQEGTALSKEAELRFQTFDSQMQLLSNDVRILFKEIGSALLPVFRDLIQAARPLVEILIDAVEVFNELPEPIRTTAVVIGGLGTAMTGVVGTVGIFLPQILNVIKAVQTLRGAQAAGGAITTLGKLGTVVGTLAGPAIIGAAVAGLAALAVSIAEAGAEAEQAALDLANANARMQELALGAEDVRQAFRTGGAEGLREFLDTLDPAIIRSKEFAAQVGQLQASGRLTRDEFSQVANIVGEYRDGIRQAAEETENTTTVVGNLTPELTELEKAIQKLGITTKKDAVESLEALTKVVDDASAAPDVLIEKWEEVAGQFDDLATGITPEVRDQLNELSLEIHDQGGELTAAQIALLSYGDAQRVVADQVRENEQAHAELRARLDQIISSAIPDLAANPPKIPIETEFVFGPPPSGGPPQGFFSKLFGGFGSIFSAGEGGLFDPGNIAGTIGGILSGGDVMGSIERLVSQIGGQIGQAVAGPIGAAVGQLAGKLVGIIGDAFSESTGESLVSDFGKFLGLQISEDFGDTLGEQFGRDSTDAVLRGLDQIVEEVGSLDLSQFEKITDRALKSAIQRFDAGKTSAAEFVDSLETALPILAQDLERFNEQGLVTQQTFEDFLVGAIQPLDRVRQGTLDATDAAKIYEASFEDIQSALDGFGLAGQEALRRIIVDSRELGVEVEAITDLVTESVEKISGGVSGLLDAGITSIEQGRLAAAGLAASFGELRAQGIPVRDIVSQIGGDAKEVGRVFREEFGEQAPKGIRQLIGFTNLLSKEGVPELIDRATAAGDIFEGLADIGLASQETFSDFATTVTQSFDELVASGGNSRQAIAALAPELQQIADAQAEFGFQVDAGTQKLLDQATAQGAVEQAGISTADAITQGFDGLFQRFDAFLGKQGVATDGFFQFGQQGQTALAGLDGAISNTAFNMETRFQTASTTAGAALSGLQGAASTTLQGVEQDADQTAQQVEGEFATSLDQVATKFDATKTQSQTALQNLKTAAEAESSAIQQDLEAKLDQVIGKFQFTEGSASGDLQAIKLEGVLASSTLSQEMITALTQITAEMSGLAAAGQMEFSSLADSAADAALRMLQSWRDARQQMTGASIIPDLVEEGSGEFKKLGDAGEQAATRSVDAFRTLAEEVRHLQELRARGQLGPQDLAFLREQEELLRMGRGGGLGPQDRAFFEGRGGLGPQDRAFFEGGGIRRGGRGGGGTVVNLTVNVSPEVLTDRDALERLSGELANSVKARLTRDFVLRGERRIP